MPPDTEDLVDREAEAMPDRQSRSGINFSSDGTRPMPEFPLKHRPPIDHPTEPNLWTPTEENSHPPTRLPSPPQEPAFRPSSTAQSTSVDRPPPRHPEQGESLQHLLSPLYELPRVDPAYPIRIDEHVSTSLVPEETAVLDDESSVLPLQPTVRSTLETEFRHGFWRRRRKATYDELAKIEGPSEVLLRFRDCGSKSWIQQKVGDDRSFRIRTNKCKNRWCEACNTEKRRTVRRNLIEQLPNGQLRFLTFTLKANHNPLGDEIKRLYECFKKWRKHAWFKKKIKGGIFFLEITYNHKTSAWHPHLHCLVDSEFLPQKEMRHVWLALTGDSFIVDIRRISDTNSAAGEVAKYATKAVSGTVWRHPELLNEAINALKGRRTFQCFGTWSKLSLSRLPESEDEWEDVGTLAWFIQRAQRGEAPAIATLNSIIGNHLHEPHQADPQPP